jgi:hypothetical protein
MSVGTKADIRQTKSGHGPATRLRNQFSTKWDNGMHSGGSVLLAMLTIVMMIILSVVSGRLPIWP